MSNVVSIRYRNRDFSKLAKELENAVKEREGDGKPAKVVPISESSEPELYKLLDKVASDYHSEDVEHCRIALAWHYGWHADVDGVLKLYDVKALPEIQRRIMGLDFLIVLNADCWQEFSPESHRAILDEALEYIGPKIDEEGNQVMDKTGLRQWRKRKPAIASFPGPVERNGFFTHNLQEFAKTVLVAKDNPLFAAQLLGSVQEVAEG